MEETTSEKKVKLFVAVKACIINDKGEVLLLREANNYKDGTRPGQYDVPGGRIHELEMLQNALHREVFEETGLSVIGYAPFDAHDTFNQKGDEMWHIVRIFYSVMCESGDIVLSDDHDDCLWVKPEDIETIPGVIDNMIPTIKKLIR